jgi:hypothetical protein
VRTTQVAEPLDGPIMSRYRELARSHGLWLSLGGFQVLSLSLDTVDAHPGTPLWLALLKAR